MGNPINFSSEALADQVNKRTAGIRQMAALMDVQRIKRQNELNRRLVQKQQDLTYGTNAEGDNVAGSDDNITIGDQYITISGQEPSAAAAQQVQPVAPQPAAQPTNGGGFIPSGGLLFPNQNGTPIIVQTGNQTPTQASGGTVGGVPVSKIWPIVASALMGSALGAGAVGYALRPQPTPVDPLRWALQFDQQAAQANPGGVAPVAPNPTGGTTP